MNTVDPRQIYLLFINTLAIVINTLPAQDRIEVLELSIGLLQQQLQNSKEAE